MIEKKRYAEAEPLLKRAIAIREKASPDSPELGDALYALASLYKKQGRATEAEPLLKRSAAMSDKVGTGRKPAVVAASPPKMKDQLEGGNGMKAAREKAEGYAKDKEAAEQAAGEQAKAAEEAKQSAEASQRRAAEQQLAAERQRAQQESEAMTAAKEDAAPPAASAPAPSDGMFKKFAKPRARAYRRAAPPGAAAPSAPMTTERGVLDEKSGGGGVSEKKMEAPAGGMAEEAAPPVAMTQAPTASEDAAPPPAPAATPEGGPAAQSEKWDVVPVFYGTDRAEEANPKRLSYGSDRGHRLELGRALVTVPKLHEVPQIERPWALRIPYFNVTIYEEAEDPNKHFTMQEIKKLTKDDLLKMVRARLAASSRFKDQALVFVHGYNTAFDNAVYRTAQIAYDLKFDGAPFLYSWPSGGAVASYTYDRESAEASKPYMRQFLEMVVKETGAKSVSIIAHSMGNQPLMSVLKDMKSSAPEGVVISQIIFAAPDVDADNFSNLAQAINGMAKGVTLYAASNDRALIVSRNFWGHTRAGDVPAEGPLVLPGIDTIDVTAASTDVFALNHSEYAKNAKVLEDIGELIETGKRPPEDRVLKPDRVTTDHGAYWRYAAHPGSP